MTIDAPLQVRLFVDSLLQVVKDGLARYILGQYKAKFGNNYMSHIQEALRTASTDYPPDIFMSESMVISTVDPSGWLSLILRRWELFSQRLGSAGKGHVERLRDIRNQWAHSRPITPQQAMAAAESAIYLLGACGSPEQQHAREIYQEISRLETAEHPTQPNAATNGNGTAPRATSDGETVLLTPVHTNDDFYIEIVDKDGQVCYQLVPMNVDRVIVGRGSNSHIRLSDPCVSRTHLLLMRNSQGLKLTDLRSGNGTKHDGTQVKPNEELHWMPGEVVTIGDTWLILKRGTPG